VTSIDSEEPEIAVTGNAWLGKGIGSIWTMVRNSFNPIPNNIKIAAYAVTEGDGEFFELLDNVLTRKANVTMIINRFYNQDEPAREKLLKLQEEHMDNFVLLNFDPEDKREDLHAKIIVADQVALVGSANLTWKGMVMNHELMVRLTGEPANSVAELIHKLSKHPECKPVIRNPK